VVDPLFIKHLLDGPKTSHQLFQLVKRELQGNEKRVFKLNMVSSKLYHWASELGRLRRVSGSGLKVDPYVYELTEAGKKWVQEKETA